MNRSIIVNRRVVSYESVEVKILKFLNDCGCELVPMLETGSLEIRIPSKCTNYTNFIGQVRFGDLKYEVSHARRLIRDGKTHVVLSDHEDEIQIYDHLLTDSMVTLK